MSEPRGVDTRTASIGDLDGIVLVSIKDGAVLDGEHAQENIAAMFEVSKDPKLRIISDIRGLKTATKTAREVGASDEFAAKVRCMGLVVGSAATRVIGSFFMRINRPKYPTQLFTSVEDAEAWIRTFDE